MKPEQFIRDFGVEKAREVVEGAPGFPVFGYCTLTGNYIFKRSNATAYYHNETNSWSEDYAIELILLEDLKRLVESVDLVESWGGIEDLKLYDLSHCKDKPESAGYKLLKAIADYESIYGGGENA
ncbi:hypothetical protein F4T80_19375 [Acinetobacter pittii]|uniref:hypothetical protein n=1 Tax=Acinetobacter pittii TaxID=48296 RepID=UPI000A33B737|nr:hypothetical protein [Acinetobacter pittii]MRA20555.1 hypothetical protein [Acinetobacter pittii]OTL31549.1 hypothetical protein B9X76_06810 [Acinetobacter pittii]